MCRDSSGSSLLVSLALHFSLSLPVLFLSLGCLSLAFSQDVGARLKTPDKKKEKKERSLSSSFFFFLYAHACRTEKIREEGGLRPRVSPVSLSLGDMPASHRFSPCRSSPVFSASMEAPERHHSIHLSFSSPSFLFLSLFLLFFVFLSLSTSQALWHTPAVDTVTSLASIFFFFFLDSLSECLSTKQK